MLIINADDWGRSIGETEAALACVKAGRVTSVSAMVFMADSARAAKLAHEHHVDVGLHLNLTEQFTGGSVPRAVEEDHERIIRYLKGSKHAQLIYHPLLRRQFTASFTAQLMEFERLYGRPPSHVDGHHHMHLCSNMLLSAAIPTGMKMRRNFSFWPGEKSFLNRTYRALVDRWLGRRFRLPDYFFCVLQTSRAGRMDRVKTLAQSAHVELMTHPVVAEESRYLLSGEFTTWLQGVQTGSYSQL